MIGIFKMVRRNTLVIRVDTNNKIGLGHFMRCRAFAQAWAREGGHSIFVMAGASQMIKKRLVSNDIQVELLDSLVDEIDYINKIGDQNSAEWLIIDGYQFGAEYMQVLKERRWKILLIDDGVPLPYYPVDIILNQNQYVDESIYADKTDAKLLIGTQYAAVQEEFFRTRSWRRDFPNIGSKLLITFGGADPNNNTMGIINSIIENCSAFLSKIDTRIIIAGTNKQKPSIENLVKYLKNIQVFSDAQNMADHIRWCDVAVSSAGYTVIEASLYQTPMILIPNSNNEKQLASKMNEIGASIVFMDLQEPNCHSIVNLICKLLKDGDKRKQLGKAAGRLVDGNGTSRVIDEMLNLSK